GRQGLPPFCTSSPRVLSASECTGERSGTALRRGGRIGDGRYERTVRERGDRSAWPQPTRRGGRILPRDLEDARHRFGARPAWDGDSLPDHPRLLVCPASPEIRRSVSFLSWRPLPHGAGA